MRSIPFDLVIFDDEDPVADDRDMGRRSGARHSPMSRPRDPIGRWRG